MLEITNENFEAEVLKAEKPVFIDFWATWCGPCRMMSPVFEEFGSSRDDVIVGKVNVDEAPALAQQFGVMSIPTVVVVKGGAEVNRTVGLSSVADLNAVADNII